jgi:hypothetical protein
MITLLNFLLNHSSYCLWLKNLYFHKQVIFPFNTIFFFAGLISCVTSGSLFGDCLITSAIHLINWLSKWKTFDLQCLGAICWMGWLPFSLRFSAQLISHRQEASLRQGLSSLYLLLHCCILSRRTLPKVCSHLCETSLPPLSQDSRRCSDFVVSVLILLPGVAEIAEAWCWGAHPLCSTLICDPIGTRTI